MRELEYAEVRLATEKALNYDKTRTRCIKAYGIRQVYKFVNRFVVGIFGIRIS